MKPLSTICAAFIGLLTGCAMTQVAEPTTTSASKDMRPPERVLVYDFVGNPGDLPPDSAIARHLEQQKAPQTQQQIELGRRLGRQVAQDLIAELKAAGIPAESAISAGSPEVGDAVVRGEFVTVDAGSGTGRVRIGFRAGAGELKTLAETFVVTPAGLRPLGATQVQASGGKLPGVLVHLGVDASATTAAKPSAARELQEGDAESIKTAAMRTAKELAKLIIDAYLQRGWRLRFVRPDTEPYEP